MSKYHIVKVRNINTGELGYMATYGKPEFGGPHANHDARIARHHLPGGTTMPTQTVAEIDRGIDAIHDELIAIAGPFDELSSAAWQDAWDAHPGLRRRERALYDERYDAQRAQNRTAAREARKPSRPRRVQPKFENAFGDSFAAWQTKLAAALAAEGIAAPANNWQVAAFNCNYLPEVAAYEAACEVNPARRLRHVLRA